MTQPSAAIDSKAAFEARLKDLVDAAELGDVDIRGAYGIETTRDNDHYDVEVTEVHPRRD